MTESPRPETDSSESDSSELHDDRPLPDDLPPVEPPSAKIVAQLFLVPGVIVLAIACVWLLLTRLASTDQDWKALVRGVETRNEHERWRSAFGLAQLLQSDAKAPPEEQKLVLNTELAGTLSKLFSEEIRQPSKGDDDIEKRVFLAATLGLFKTPDVVLPALCEGLDTSDRGVRNASLRSISTVLGNGFLAGSPSQDQVTLEVVTSASADSDPLIRSLAAYTLGMFEFAKSQARLEVLLNDPSEGVRANAAIALVRHKSLLAVPQLKKMLAIGAAPSEADPKDPNGKQEEQFSRRLQVLNALTGIGSMKEVLPESDRKEFAALIEKLAEGDSDPGIRVQAQDTLVTLNGK